MGEEDGVTFTPDQAELVRLRVALQVIAEESQCGWSKHVARSALDGHFVVPRLPAEPQQGL